MKKLVVLSLVLLSVAATVSTVMANGPTTVVGGVVLPATNYFGLVVVALFVLWFAFLVFRKRNTIFKHFGPTFLR
jgi:hypothetical protein